MKVARGTETGEAPTFRQAQGVPSRSRDAWQGATSENSGPMRLRSNSVQTGCPARRTVVIHPIQSTSVVSS